CATVPLYSWIYSGFHFW
nr:immunoglobulin heavy chain junction region [Macaca mulatta]